MKPIKSTFAVLGSLLALSQAGAAVVGPASGAVDGVQPATVLDVNPAGIGHVNLVPYFSVRSGFDTYLNLTNTDTRNGKAVKLRFRSGYNGEDIGNFTVLLGPGDVWAAAITRDAATGYPRVVHGDRSCTLPADVQTTLGSIYQGRVNSSGNENPTPSLDGSVEIITLADIPQLTSGGQVAALHAAVTVSGGTAVPTCSAAALDPLASDSGSYADARSKGLEVPTSGLMTQWTLINVPRAVSYSGRATAVEARVAANGSPGYGNIVLFPQTSEQVVDEARTKAYTTNPNIRGGARENKDGVAGSVFPNGGQSYVQHQFPDLSTPYLPAGLSGALGPGVAPRLQAFAVSKALAATSIGGEFVTDPGLLAKTDWLVSLPTRYLQVGYIPESLFNVLPSATYTNLTVDDAGAPVGNGVKNFFQSDVNAQLDPYSGIYPMCVSGIDPYANGTANPGQPQTATGFRAREGSSITLQTPPPVGGIQVPFRLCGHSSVLRFARPGADAADGVLGDVRNRWPMISSSTAGWGRIQIPGVAGQGLPIIGFAVSELYNSAVKPGTAGVFGVTFPLSTTRP
ncbi:MAG: hypothetical protein QM750_17745 [Rubrivivax sp.]